MDDLSTSDKEITEAFSRRENITVDIRGSATVIFGDTHHHETVSSNALQNVNENEFVAAFRTRLREENQSLVDAREREYVPLDIIANGAQDFGSNGDFNQVEVDDKPEKIGIEDLFKSARAHAQNLKSSRTGKAQSQFVEKYANLVGVTGDAGIGKSTAALEYVNYSLKEDENYAFYVSLKDFNDLSIKMTVLDFILQSTGSKEELGVRSQQQEKALLKFLDNSEHVHVILDSPEEAKIDNLEDFGGVVRIHNESNPVDIMKNILAGNVLKKSRKIVFSRPSTYNRLGNKTKPKFTVKIAGLGLESQQLLCKCIVNESIERNECDETKGAIVVKKFPSSSKLSFMPVFAEPVVHYLLTYSDGCESSSSLYMFLLEDCWKHGGSDNLAIQLQELCKSAFQCLSTKTAQFRTKEIISIGHRMKRFLRWNKLNQTGSFTHQTWRDFFAALYLMGKSSEEEFVSVLNELELNDWNWVPRFMLGISSSTQKLAKMNLTSPFSETRKQRLWQKVVQLASGLHEVESSNPLGLQGFWDEKFQEFARRNDNRLLYTICSMILEAHDDNLTRTVVEELPEEILLTGEILPNDVTGLGLILQARRNRPISINVGDFTKPARFYGDALETFLNGLQPHKIKKLHAKDLKLHGASGNNLPEKISQNLQSIDELLLRNCEDLTAHDLNLFTIGMQSRSSPVHLLDLSNTSLNDESMDIITANIEMYERLELIRCNIKARHVKPLAEKLLSRKTPLKWLQLDENEIGCDGAGDISKCLSMVQELALSECGIKVRGVRCLSEAVSGLPQPMLSLVLDRNEFGNEGADMLAGCFHLIEILSVSECGITSAAKVSTAVASLHKRMKKLNLNENKLGRSGGKLAECVHNICSLYIKNCDIGKVGMDRLADRISELDLPVEFLDFDGNFEDGDDYFVEKLRKCGTVESNKFRANKIS